ncbi:MAG: hypothetical protein EAZ89_05745 [Bacteroidetes bacterium]|jgi:hypothetical protein|nr:MAG: hypothetical protein EAZ89_05745 [Bacteroidota bacterium]
MLFRRFSFPLLLMLVFSACSQGNVDLDNAGSSTLHATVDELKYILPPRTYLRIKLEKGPHTLVVNDSSGKTLEQTTFRIEEGGLLNLAKANYIIWTDLYGDPALRPQKLKEDWLEIGKNTYFGEFERLDPSLLYVEQKWDYPLTEPFPDDLLGWEISKEKWIVKRKLFREPDLVAAYKSIATKK